VNGLAPQDADTQFRGQLVIGVENDVREHGMRRHSPIVAKARHGGKPGRDRRS
jgi:hypothetical protein